MTNATVHDFPRIFSPISKIGEKGRGEVGVR